jgi:hypothetical protein
MKYSITINNEAKAQTNNFDQMVAFVKSSDFNYDENDIIMLTYIQEGDTYIVGARGINCQTEFSDVLFKYRLGR